MVQARSRAIRSGKYAVVFLVTIASPVVGERRAHAEDPAEEPKPVGGPIDPDLVATPLAPAPSPPPLDEPYLQYGVSLAAEVVTSAGKICATSDPCVLGSGGGIAARVGRRSAGAWYFGGAYEMTKQDPANLYRFATLQQLRGEARYYVVTGLDVQPFAAVGLGVAGYGNEWGIDTWGPLAYLGGGVEAQLSRTTVVGLALAYRALALRSFVDTSNLARDAGISQILGIEISLEERDPIASRRTMQ